MRGSCTSQSRARPYHERKTVKRFCNNEHADNIILIDADDEHLDDVIIIDVPDSLLKKQKGSTMPRNDRNQSVETVICIEDDESPDWQSDISSKNGEFATSTSTTKSFVPPTNNIEGVDVDESQTVPDKVTPVRLSKCKRTYSGKVFSGICYGLNADSESDSSARDYPDCELMEDVSGKVKANWEKASSRRKKGIMDSQSCLRDPNNTARAMNNNSFQHVGKGQMYGNKKVPVCSRTDKFINKDANGSHFHTKESAHDNNTCTSTDVLHCGGKHSSNIHTCHTEHQHFVQRCSRIHNENRLRHPSMQNSSHHEHSTKDAGSTSAFEVVEECPILEHCRSKSKCGFDGSVYFKKASSEADDARTRKCEIPVEDEVDRANNLTRSKLKEFPETAADRVEKTTHLDSCEALEPCGVKKMQDSLSTSCILSDKPKDCNFSSMSVENGPVHEKSLCLKSSSLISGDVSEKGCHVENMLAVDELPCNDIHINVTKHQGDEFLSNCERENKDDLDTENEPEGNAVQTCVTTEREMIKETDEYKRAMEEEWAARQQVLKIQAEEARHLIRLQKRRKAESLRLLDMERRQKQRVEEIRNTQKKDEENMNLKEAMRMEVRKELDMLEATCHDMASLLHSFGIQVVGWPNPLQHEVQAAYKRALRAFHPDRASQSDLRHQMEAEEKFKLMNSFKEKFSLFS